MAVVTDNDLRSRFSFSENEIAQLHADAEKYESGEWPEGEGYAAWQKAKLPRFRLGVPDGSLLAQEIDDLLAGLPR